MQTFEMPGNAGITLQYAGDLLDSALGMEEAILNPPQNYYFHFSGGVTGLAQNLVLTGATSGILTVDKVVITSGTLGGSDAQGVIFAREITGALTLGQNMDNGVTTYCIARSALTLIPHQEACGLLLCVETNSMLITICGAPPINSGGTPASFGILLNAMDSFPVKGWRNTRNFKMINAVAAANAKATITVFYGGQG